MNDTDKFLRLGNKYARADAPAVDVARLEAEQSLPAAAAGGALASVVLIAVWAWTSLLFDRYFPWFSLVQGYFIGLAVRRFGRGLDWRFPLLAAVLTCLAAFFGSFVAALFLTGREFGVPALSLLGELSWYTVNRFASEQFAIVGTIYAGMAAVIAAFFANRKLDRREAAALHRERRAARR